MATAQVIHDLHPVQCLHVGMDIVTAYITRSKVVCQFFGHALGERGDQHPFILLHPLLDLFHQIIYLVQAGAHIDGRVEQSRGAYQLIHDDPFRFLQLIIGRCGTHEDDLLADRLKLLELERTVIDGCRQTEAILHQVHLAGVVAAIHGTYLRDGHMALIDHGKVIIREEVEEAEGACTGQATVKIP